MILLFIVVAVLDLDQRTSMTTFLADYGNGPSQQTISSLLVLDEIQKQGNTLKMCDFKSITQITDLRSRVKSGIAMLDQIL